MAGIGRSRWMTNPSWPKSSLLLISGPTAVGKSDFALQIAQDLDGEIVNIDSVQLYRGVDIGSAKPSLEDRNLVRHHLIDILDPNEQGTVARYLAEAERALADIRSRGRLPIFVGGTGLYVTSLLQGLASLPAADPALRAALESRQTEDLKSELQQRDPEASQKLHINDRVRIIRALESVLMTGEKASEIRRQHGHRLGVHPAVCLIPLLERGALYARIDRRAAEMIQRGLLTEVQRLVSEFGPEAPALDAIGYQESLAVTRGELAESNLALEIAKNTRRLAKQQLTFWRNEPHKRNWFVRPTGADPAVSISGVSQSKRSPVKPMPALALERADLTRQIRERLLQPIENSEVWFFDISPMLAS